MNCHYCDDPCRTPELTYIFTAPMSSPTLDEPFRSSRRVRESSIAWARISFCDDCAESIVDLSRVCRSIVAKARE